MSKKLGLTLALAAAIAIGAAALASAGYHKQTVIRAGDVIVSANGSISPSVLPKHTLAPIKASTSGSVATVDGSHPPAAKTVVVNIDRSFAINAKGLPLCREGQISASSTVAAKRACPNSIVGSGSAEAEVAFPEQAPFSARGPIVFFNGGTKGGHTLLLVHLYASVPAPTAIVTAVTISKAPKGHYGLHAVARVPVIAGGSGSVTKFKFTVNRKFRYRGQEQSYLEAACPTGTYFTEVQASFRDGPSLQGTIALPCTPKG